MKRLFLLILAFLSIVLVIVACQPPSIKPKAAAKAVIRIGVALSATGEFAREANDNRQGYKLWEEWVNKEYGGIPVGDKRYQVQMIYYDDESNADTASRLVEKLITEDKVNFMMSPYGSSLTKGASAISEKYNTIMLAAAAADSLFTRGFKNLFSIIPSASNYTKETLQAVAQAGAKTLVIAYEDTSFPKNIAEGVQKWANKFGIKVVGVETYPKDVADVNPIMNKFKAVKPDLFVGGGHFNDALLFVHSAKEQNFKPKAIVITTAPSNPKFVKEIGADANYIVGPTSWESSMKYQDKYFGTSADYAKRYQAKWGELPTYQAANSTAAGLTLQLAIEKAGSLNTDAVRKALQDLNVTTFYGPIKFSPKGINITKPMATIQILNQKIQLVAPADIAQTKLVYPAPGK